jgi:hypothetical protein
LFSIIIINSCFFLFGQIVQPIFKLYVFSFNNVPQLESHAQRVSGSLVYSSI